MKKLLLIGTAVLLMTASALQPASALYCSTWRICAAKLRYQAAWRAQHPGQNYATMLRDCLRTHHVARDDAFGLEGCAARVGALRK